MRKISIMGDSISTFEGCNPRGYAVYYDPEMQEANEMKSVEDTWWMQVIRAMGGGLCVNDSYSGSLVSGMFFPAAISDERLDSLRTETDSPDIILIYMGVNDYGYGVKISREQMGLHFSREHRDFHLFEDAYDGMLKGMRERFPGTAIVCGTLMSTAVKYRPGWGFSDSCWGTELKEYNDTIRMAAAQNGCLLADLAGTGLRYETLDGTHPTAKGHGTIAEAWIRSLGDLNLIMD